MFKYGHNECVSMRLCVSVCLCVCVCVTEIVQQQHQVARSGADVTGVCGPTQPTLMRPGRL